jgi:hypothetical protein
MGAVSGGCKLRLRTFAAAIPSACNICPKVLELLVADGQAKVSDTEFRDRLAIDFQEVLRR